VRLAPPRVEDAEALTDLHLDVWEEAYADLVPASLLAERRAGRAQRVERWRGIIASGSSDTLLAWSTEGRLLGFVSTGGGRDSPDDGLPPLELMALYVRAEVYGDGLGHALCEAAIGSSPAYLWVLEGNERAITFYERQGFRFDGATKSEDVGLERRMVRRPSTSGLIVMVMGVVLAVVGVFRKP
jgi:GNAT superfamily N-acetyltransferase